MGAATLGFDRRRSLATPQLGPPASALAPPAGALGVLALGVLAAAEPILAERPATVRGQPPRALSAEQARRVSAGGRGGGRGRSPMERARHVSSRGASFAPSCTSAPLPCSASAPLPCSGSSSRDLERRLGARSAVSRRGCGRGAAGSRAAVGSSGLGGGWRGAAGSTAMAAGGGGMGGGSGGGTGGFSAGIAGGTVSDIRWRSSPP